jgi:hypothetical protein
MKIPTFVERNVDTTKPATVDDTLDGIQGEEKTWSSGKKKKKKASNRIIEWTISDLTIKKRCNYKN